MDNELIRKLEYYIKMEHFINLDDIIDIINIINSFESGNIYKGYVINQDDAFIMSYSFITNKININFNKMKETIETSYRMRKHIKLIDNVMFFNASVILCILHELIHSSQAMEIENCSDLGTLYKKSVDILFYNKKIISNLYRWTYIKYHDMFSIEINANYNSYIKLLYILKSINHSLYELFLSNLIDYANKIYQFNEFEELHSLLKESEIIECLKKKLNYKEKVINGVEQILPTRGNILNLINK